MYNIYIYSRVYSLDSTAHYGQLVIQYQRASAQRGSAYAATSAARSSPHSSAR